jgi:hypothetical protein
MDLPLKELVKTSDYTPEQLKAMYDVIEKKDHDLWVRCYPRIYSDYKPGLYGSAKDPARQMWCCASKVEMGFLGDSEKYEMMWASQIARSRCPQYWVTPDLVEAIMQTKPPMNLAWHDMNLPHEAASFMLPKGAITHKKDGDLVFVSYTRNKQGVDIPSLARKGPRHFTALNGSFCVFAKTPAFFIHWNMPHDVFPVVNLLDIDTAIRQHEHHIHSSGWLTATMDSDDTEVGIKTTHLIFGLILFMLRKPELIDGGELIKRIPAKKGDAPKEFWTPKVIGRNYRIRRIGQDLGGHHASPRGHWVTGFWRDQHYGVKYSLIKEIWVEPYWRGGDEGGDEEGDVESTRKEKNAEH